MTVWQVLRTRGSLSLVLVMLALVLTACIRQTPPTPVAPPEAAEEADSDEQEASEEDGHGASEWSYEGSTGPEKWGTLSPDFEMCSDGESQSPINIETSDMESEDHELEIDYEETPVTLINNGHTIKINYAPGSTITFDGTTYELLQFHFHEPGEHSLDDELAAMELHLVHQSEEGDLAVIGLLIESGETNAVIEDFWGEWATRKSETSLDEVTVNIADILPEDRSLYTYEGSLTTPPCSEGVRWIMMQNPIEFSAQQIDTYAEILADTNRPVQPLNERTIYSTTEE